MKVLSKVASLCNEAANTSKNGGRYFSSALLYRLSIMFQPNWSVPWYNLGLQYKYAGNWTRSLDCNRRAAELTPDDQASWWNLGIAATALSDWEEARRAWAQVGVSLEPGSGEALMAPMTGCVRLDPQGAAEVVWGSRIDPARMIVLNVPLPQSGHRYHDVVINDGAQEGTRLSDGHEYPVFDGLGIWKKSTYSTFETTIVFPNDDAKSRLQSFCDERDIGCEDWRTIRTLCRQCSLGNPDRHACVDRPVSEGRSRFGFGARSREELLSVLDHWVTICSGCGFEDVRLLLYAGG
jgi:tetratricopeptide (TPR) repeat protein